MSIDFIQDDILHWANTYHGPKFHALLCDPPYHLTNRVVDWEGFKDPHQGGRGQTVLTRNGEKGFMGSSWDGGDIAFRPDTWAALAEHLLPGAFLMAFAGCRTYHRMACAVEGAGMIIFPDIAYIFGSGFPKATQISNQIDKKAGATPKVIGREDGRSRYDGAKREEREKFTGIWNAGEIGGNTAHDITAPTTPLAQTWAGHRYGLQALKPAFEHILVAQKPYEGKPVDSIVETGAGALAIDAARIPAETRPLRQHGGEYTESVALMAGSTSGYAVGETNAGRWPANLLLDDSAAARLDEMSGVLTSGSRAGVYNGSGFIDPRPSQNGKPVKPTVGDSGGASRYFYTYPAEVLDEADPFFYCAKSSRKERDAGLDELPLKPLKTHGEMQPDNSGSSHNTTGQKPALARNGHPCVKPLSLCRYLSTLLLPPAEYAPRRLLVPFCGSGSEAIGAMQAGWDEIVAIEREAEYIEIGQARAEYWSKQVAQLELPV